MRSVAITGVSGALGRRIVAAMADTGAWEVVGVDIAPFPAAVAIPRRFTVHRADLRNVELKRLFEGVDSVIHLAAGDPADASLKDDDVVATARVLDAASAVGVRSLVVVSSAAVYGAWDDNPVPLTEDAPLRPNPGFRYAETKAEAERVTATWRREHPGVAVAVLRPAATLGHPDAKSWLADVVRPSLADRLTRPLPSLQFVHVDDVASAVLHALSHRLDGAFNVASTDWIQGDEAPELLGPNIRLPVPVWMADALAWAVEHLFGVTRRAGAIEYSRAPWVIATDRLQATGWAPHSTSAEAFVANARPSPIRRFVARHRQEVALGAVGAGAISALGTLGLVLRRFRRRR